jgi:DNA-binding response OmpR family regulator
MKTADQQGPAKILVIDDEESFRRFITRFLTKKGFDVLTASEGRSGVGLAAEKLPNLIICDLIMPGMSGYEVLATLRTDDRLADIPIVFLTGQSEPRDVRVGMNLGADDYLTKPVSLEDLLGAIKVRLDRQQGQTRRHEQALEKALSQGPQPRTEPGDPLQATFLVKTSTEKHLVKVGDIQRIMAYGEYSWVYWRGHAKGALLRKSLKQWLAELPGDTFMRVHRRAIVNLAGLDRVERLSGGRLQVCLREFAEPIPVSLRLAPALNRRLTSRA